MIKGLRLLRYAIVTLVILLIIWKVSKSSSAFDPRNSKSNVKVSEERNPSTDSSPAKLLENAGPSSGAIANKDFLSSEFIQRENATFVTLARNEDLWGLVGSIREVEDRFNYKYHYDWVFLNDKEFTDEFKEVTTKFASGKTIYGLIPPEHWGYPDFISQDKAAQTREDMKGIIYGWSESYRHMCRFESGFFWRNKALDNYRYYWRVEPHIKLMCDIDEDPFKFMRVNNKRYGFTISLKEYEATIETLWQTVKSFMSKFPHYLHKNNALDFVSNDGGETYNLCHFWSNFEIGDLDFWRGEAYKAFFDHLDKAGGFFYERWGDAPVHSIAASLLLDKDELHFFDKIGYWHVPFQSCPVSKSERLRLKCTCPLDEHLEADQRNIFTFKGYSCTEKFYKVTGREYPEGWREHI